MPCSPLPDSRRGERHLEGERATRLRAPHSNHGDEYGVPREWERIFTPTPPVHHRPHGGEGRDLGGPGFEKIDIIASPTLHRLHAREGPGDDLSSERGLIPSPKPHTRYNGDWADMTTPMPHTYHGGGEGLRAEWEMMTASLPEYPEAWPGGDADTTRKPRLSPSTRRMIGAARSAVRRFGSAITSKVGGPLRRRHSDCSQARPPLESVSTWAQ